MGGDAGGGIILVCDDEQELSRTLAFEHIGLRVGLIDGHAREFGADGDDLVRVVIPLARYSPQRNPKEQEWRILTSTTLAFRDACRA